MQHQEEELNEKLEEQMKAVRNAKINQIAFAVLGIAIVTLLVAVISIGIVFTAAAILAPSSLIFVLPFTFLVGSVVAMLSIVPPKKEIMDSVIDPMVDKIFKGMWNKIKKETFDRFWDYYKELTTVNASNFAQVP